jgi:hypothetical protein
MNHRTALVGSILTAGFAATASADLAINLGTVQQVSPRPSIVYTGAYGAFVSSAADASGTRTVTSFDLHGIVQQLGGNLALVEVRVRDTGTNTYGTWSPGADIDLLRITGANLAAGRVSAGYLGSVAQHLGETADVLATRIASCDAVSGDQHFNSQHFVSLGQNGTLSMLLSDFAVSTGGSGGSGGGGGGPGSWSGGGDGGTVLTGLVIGAGMRLEIGEAGLGESYGAELVFTQVPVPAPGALALLSCAGLTARRRRR